MTQYQTYCPLPPKPSEQYWVCVCRYTFDKPSENILTFFLFLLAVPAAGKHFFFFFFLGFNIYFIEIQEIYTIIQWLYTDYIVHK